MNRMLEWLNHASGAWWEYVWQSSWQAALVGGLLLGLVHGVGRRWAAPLRYALLVLALLKFACPPLLPVPTGLFSQWAAARPEAAAAPERKPLTERTPKRGSALPGWSPRARGLSAVLGSGAVHWTVWLMLAHGLGMVGVAVWLGRQARQLRGVAGGSPAKLGEALGGQYRDLAIALGVFPIPPLAISEAVAAPMAFGLKRPTIALPPKMLERLSAEELKAVLAHELAHCQRGDLWLNGVQLLLLSIWWFHPVFWLIHRGLQDAREDCCDDLLLARALVSNDAYCDTLLHAAAELCPDPGLQPGLGLLDRIHPLGRRLARITDWTLQRRERVSGAGALGVLGLALLLLPGVSRRETVWAAPAPAKPVALAAVPSLISAPRVGAGGQVPRLKVGRPETKARVAAPPIAVRAERSAAGAPGGQGVRGAARGMGTANAAVWAGAGAGAMGAGPVRTPPGMAGSRGAFYPTSVGRLGPYDIPPVPGSVGASTWAAGRTRVLGRQTWVVAR